MEEKRATISENEAEFLSLFRSMPQVEQLKVLGYLEYCNGNAQRRFEESLRRVREIVQSNPIHTMDIYDDPFREFR